MMVPTYNDYINGDCSFAEYKATLKLVKPEINKTYIQNKGHWSEKHFKIIFSDGKVCMGKCVYNAIGETYTGEYRMFNVADGFTYQDLRTDYRLTEELL